MSELYIKSPEKNTLGEKRVQAINEGGRLTAAPVMAGGPGAMGAEAVGVSDIRLNGRTGVIDDPGLTNHMPSPVLQSNVNVGAFVSGLEAPLKALNGKSIAQLIRERGLTADGNSLVPEWANLWDAMRIDLTIRKIARPTVRELIYNVSDTPNATRSMNINEMLPHGVIFKENNGTGQSVRQAELRGGLLDTAIQKIYAAGLTWDLMASLFAENYTDTSINDAVAIGESGLKDDLALAPIFAYSYSGDQLTAADTTGTTREEKWYRTLQNGAEDLGKRRDPVTNRELGATGLILLASPTDAKRAASVLGGSFPAANSNGPFTSLDSTYSRVIGYDPETIVANSETVSYTPVTTGKAYVIKPNRRMIIAIKRRLQLNVNMNPDPATLAQEERAWWFCEALYNAGIEDFIQEVTLPAW
jgi:hypothetical protein